MAAFTFLPLAFVLACVSFTYWNRAKSAERIAAGWQDVARRQEGAIANLNHALDTQGKALDNLMRAVRGE